MSVSLLPRRPRRSLAALTLAALLLAPAWVEAAQGARQAGRGQTARPRPPSDPAWEDPAAVQAGRTALERILVEAGSLPAGFESQAVEGLSFTDVAWGQAVPGLTWQVLETAYRARRPLRDPEGPDWSVNYHVPRLLRYLPSGDGYAYSEFAATEGDGHNIRREFRRDVVAGDVIWTEHGGAIGRSNQAVTHARWIVGREFLLGAMPHSLVPLGAELVRVGDAPAIEGMAPGQGGPFGLYAVRIDRTVRPFENEWMREFYMAVDEGRWRVVQLQFQLVDTDRPRYNRSLHWGYCDYDSWTEVPLSADVREAWAGLWADHGAQWKAPERMLLPQRRSLWREEATHFSRLTSVEHEVAAPSPAAFDRPWLSERPYVPPRRPDHWDPPARQEPRGNSGNAQGGG